MMMAESTELIDVSQTDPYAGMIERICTDPGFDTDKLQQVMELKERHDAKRAESAFYAALSKAQEAVPRVVCDSTNAHTRSKYPSVFAVQETIRQACYDNGFAITHDELPPNDDGLIGLRVVMSHSGGHREEYTRFAPPDTTGSGGKANKTEVQGRQSSVSYMYRRLICGLFNVSVAEDDKDGNRDVEYMTDTQVLGLNELLDEVDKLDPGSRNRFSAWLEQATGADSLTACDKRHYDMILTSLREKKAKLND